MQRRHLTLALGAGLLAALALPARADDDGEFVILHARYGTENGHVDATDRLRDLARRDRRFKLTNDLFGVDPDPGRTKTLRIFARDRSGRERQFDYREYDWVDGALFIGWGGGRWGDAGWDRGWRGDRDDRVDRHDDGDFVILYATYGASGRDVDVTDRLRDLARRDERLRVTNELFGVDPYPGQTKVLRIVTRDRAHQQRVFEYREYQTVDGHQFLGWGRGDWGRDSDRGPVRPGYGSRFIIDSASYGAGNRWVDVTALVQAQVRGDRLDLQVRNELFGVDPAPGQRKQLSVTFRRANSLASTVRVNEYDRLRLP